MSTEKRITPDVWGGPFWRTIHVVAMGYPSNPSTEAKKQYEQFFASLETVIPCAICAQGYAAIVKENPVQQAMGNPEDLFNWTVLVHNKVSEKLRKPPMTPEFVRTVYMFGEECDHRELKIDPVVFENNWRIVSIYGASFVVLAAIAFALYLMFRSQPPPSPF
jgi:hypothetical protein